MLRAAGGSAGIAAKDSSSSSTPGAGVAMELAPLAFDKDGVEADTGEAEEVDLATLLLPDGSLPLDLQCFAVCYNKAALDGWVKQHSPACAATSVAGAWNAVFALGRGQPSALDQDKVVEILKAIVQARIDAQMERVVAQFGTEVGSIIKAVKASLLASDMSLGMKWPKGVKKRKELAKRLRTIADDTAHCEGEGITRLRELYVEEQERKQMLAEAGQTDPRPGGGDEGEDGEEDGDDGADEGAEEASPPRPLAGGCAFEIGLGGEDDGPEQPVKAGYPVGWRKNLLTLLEKQAGLEKLLRDRPSTGYFGNWGILAAVKQLKETTGRSISARIFMGKASKGSKVDIRLTSKDSRAVVAGQWDTLRACFLREKSALIYHLKNHYALVYALREWRDANGSPVRQLLTARKGQRPSAWIDFKEVRETMLKWPGYKMMAITA